jgi:hypothetical protein
MSVSISGLLLATLYLGLAAFAICWALIGSKRKKMQNRLRYGITPCRICGVRYETPEGEQVTSCPVCSTPNESQRDESL